MPVDIEWLLDNTLMYLPVVCFWFLCYVGRQHGIWQSNQVSMLLIYHIYLNCSPEMHFLYC